MSPLARMLAFTTLVALACAIPGRPVRILPEVSGRVAGGGDRVVLVAIQRQSPELHSRRELALDAEGRFRFEPIDLDVAGHEFGPHYLAYLHLRRGERDQVIWRAELSRFDDEVPIRLACDPQRPPTFGEPCRVEDPLAQKWLVADGRRHYRRLCAECHGRDGRGGAPASDLSATDAPRSSRAAADLTKIAARHGGRFDHDAIAAYVEGRSLPSGHQRGAMPVWGERLSREFARYAEGDELIGAALDPLLVYLESIQRRPGTRLNDSSRSSPASAPASGTPTERAR